MISNERRPALDPQVIDELRRLGSSIGEDLVGELTELFVGSAETRISALRTAALAHDDDGVVCGAHALRGSAAGIGAKALAQLCATLEDEWSAPGLRSTILLDVIEVELGHVCAALQEAAT